MLRDPVHLLATGFGAGLSPYAPGTVGSALALIPCWYMRSLGAPTILTIALIVFVLGIWVAGLSAARLGRHDHPAIVIDEIAAMLALTAIVPEGWAWLAAAFALFRLFDIWKPWPIRELDHSIPGGLGIMLDDVLAAVYAAVCLKIIEYSLAVI